MNQRTFRKIAYVYQANLLEIFDQHNVTFGLIHLHLKYPPAVGRPGEARPRPEKRFVERRHLRCAALVQTMSIEQQVPKWSPAYTSRRGHSFPDLWHPCPRVADA